ncbi:hypothetical protein PINS_up020139 [Pythium insidiosum]|nr:hypothetical protein PINS_up020139 [Pythium insidiosum]
MSKAEWRMLYPHMSLWNLSRERVPEWHSFQQMLAPTCLNHFLIQPMERLQFYCAVLQYLEHQLDSMSGSKMTETVSSDPKGFNLGSSSSSSSSSARPTRQVQKCLALAQWAVDSTAGKLACSKSTSPIVRVLSDVSSEVRHAALGDSIEFVLVEAPLSLVRKSASRCCPVDASTRAND